jgi:hypothetical protein
MLVHVDVLIVLLVEEHAMRTWRACERHVTCSANDLLRQCFCKTCKFRSADMCNLLPARHFKAQGRTRDATRWLMSRRLRT